MKKYVKYFEVITNNNYRIHKFESDLFFSIKEAKEHLIKNNPDALKIKYLKNYKEV